MDQKALVAAAVAGLFALGASSGALAQDKDQEKCWGVAKAGQNDCGSNKTAHSCAGKSSLATWLFGILKHKIVDGLRRGSREQPLAQDMDTLMHAGPGPEQSCASRTALLLLERSLGRLPRKSADAFVLCEVLGMDTPEACRALGVTPSHCWVLVHRARQRLRACPHVGQVAAEAG